MCKCGRILLGIITLTPSPVFSCVWFYSKSLDPGGPGTVMGRLTLVAWDSGRGTVLTALIHVGKPSLKNRPFTSCLGFWSTYDSRKLSTRQACIHFSLLSSAMWLGDCLASPPQQIPSWNCELKPTLSSLHSNRNQTKTIGIWNTETLC